MRCWRGGGAAWRSGHCEGSGGVGRGWCGMGGAAITRVNRTSKQRDICVPPSNFITNYSNFIKNVLKIYHLSRVNVILFCRSYGNKPDNVITI